MTRADLLDTDPITLKTASEVILCGIVSVSALRAEIRRRNLAAYKVGKNLFTTPRDIREMMEKCRVSPPRPASISDQTTEPGSSETEARILELAALTASVAMLKSGSLSTLRKNTPPDRPKAGSPIPFPSRRS